MDRNHRVDQICCKLRRRTPVGGKCPHYRKAVVQMTATYGVDQREFVGKVLVKGPYAYPSQVRNLVCRKASPSRIIENASASLDDRFNRRAGSGLARFLPHGGLPFCNASRQQTCFVENVHTLLTFIDTERISGNEYLAPNALWLSCLG